MTNPISGPTRSVYDFVKLYQVRDRYSQPRPRDLVLPYNMWQSKRTRCTWYNADVAQRASVYQWTPDAAFNRGAQLQAYERFKGKLSDTSSFGENTLELTKSFRTIEHKALQIAAAVRDARRRDFQSAFRTLYWGLDQKNHIHPVKQGASNWLEFHLGIQPLVGDIYNAVKVLQEPIKSYRVKARGSERIVRKCDPYSTPFYGVVGYDILSHYQYTCEVSVSNPNLWLATAMGVVNPFQVAWQMVPFSFVADWFINVESFLGSYTDLFGLTIEKAASTLFYTGKSYDAMYSPGNQYGYTLQEGEADVVGMRRSAGIDLPPLQVRPLRVWGWQRGLTAISLLVPGLKSLNRELPTRKSWGYAGAM